VVYSSDLLWYASCGEFAFELINFGQLLLGLAEQWVRFLVQTTDSVVSIYSMRTNAHLKIVLACLAACSGSCLKVH
jgi:hypothetical protein